MIHIPVMPTSLPALAAGTVLGGTLIAMVVAGMINKARDDTEQRTRDIASTIGTALQILAFAGTGLGPIAILPVLQRGDWIRALVVTLLSGAALALFRATKRAMGRNWSIIARTRADHALVTAGPFAYVRNPIYGALALLLLAEALATGHGVSLIVTLPIYMLGTIMRVRAEEARLSTFFGPQWAEYAARVPRYFPGPRGVTPSA